MISNFWQLIDTRSLSLNFRKDPKGVLGAICDQIALTSPYVISLKSDPHDGAARCGMAAIGFVAGAADGDGVDAHHA